MRVRLIKVYVVVFVVLATLNFFALNFHNNMLLMKRQKSHNKIIMITQTPLNVCSKKANNLESQEKK